MCEKPDECASGEPDSDFPEVVDCIVFWTKNAAPMMDKLEQMEEFDYYFQFTVNDYGKETEPYVPALSERLETFMRLSEMIGRERVIWRYDPILFSDRYIPEYHLKSFEKIASALGGYTEKCVFSFVDVYPSKNGGSLNRLNVRWLSDEKLDRFAGELARIGKQMGLCLPLVRRPSTLQNTESSITVALTRR